MAKDKISSEEVEFNYQLKSAELEAIIAKLQNEQTSIDDSLKLYNDAKQLIKELSEYLLSAKNQLNSLNDTSSRKK